MTYEEIVVAGGGRYVGQMRHESAGLDMVLFNAPQTGSTLAIQTNSLTVEAVRQSIDDHCRLWVKKGGKLRVQAALNRMRIEEEIEWIRRTK